MPFGHQHAQQQAGHAVPRKSLGAVPQELIGTILTYLDPKSLLTAGEVCKSIQGCIEKRQMWRLHFRYMEEASAEWEAPPEDLVSADWKTLYWQYRREVAGPPFCCYERTSISKRFRWRIGAVYDKMKKVLAIHESKPFTMSYTVNTPKGETKTINVEWKLQAQRLSKDGDDVFGVFARQEDAVECLFGISLLNHKYEVFERHLCSKVFDGQSGGKTCGWQFQTKKMRKNRIPDQLLIEFDVTIFPEGLAGLQPLYDLLLTPKSDDYLKSFVVDSLGEYLTRRASSPPQAKKYVQTANGGPLPLLKVFEDPKALPLLRSSVAGCLWNILDTSVPYIASDALLRVINTASASLVAELTGLEGFKPDAEQDECEFHYPPRNTAINLKPCMHEAALDDPALQHSPYNGPQPFQQDELKKTLINSLSGLMWNVPVTPENRAMLVNAKGFLSSMACVLSNQVFWRSHFCCFHLLCTLKLKKCLPKEYDRNFTRHLEQHLQHVQDPELSPDSQQDVGVMLSLRDITDFFLPLVMSKDLACIAFGKWAMCIFFFNKIEIYHGGS